MLISPLGSKAIHSSFSAFSVKSFNLIFTEPTFFLLKEISAINISQFFFGYDLPSATDFISYLYIFILYILSVCYYSRINLQ